MLFRTTTAKVAATMDHLRSAENKLLSFSSRFGSRRANDYEVHLVDTKIPRSVVPVVDHGYDIHDQEDYVMHGVHVSSNAPGERHKAGKTTSFAEHPLVLLHGYMNASLYFYRNLVGLSTYFPSVYSLDMLGWGGSSRPRFDLVNDSIQGAEDFFVESLEAWRVNNNIDRIILAGHSMGGYLSVAYCERYPQNVHRLILLSPVGVPVEPQECEDSYVPLRARVKKVLYAQLYENLTLGGFLRVLPRSRGYARVEEYVNRRLAPYVSNKEEQDALTEYVYHSNVLPGSGEHCLSRFLNCSIFAKQPTLHRIPNLQVDHVSFLYGTDDWMDSSAGLDVQVLCENRWDSGDFAPEVAVYKVGEAGHLLMLENWESFNAGVVQSAGLELLPQDRTAVPTKLCPYAADTGSDGAATPMMVQNLRNGYQQDIPMAA